LISLRRRDRASSQRSALKFTLGQRVALAAARPAEEADLLEVRGIGPSVVKNYGAQLLALLATGAP
jgi:HRDC domain